MNKKNYFFGLAIAPILLLTSCASQSLVRMSYYDEMTIEDGEELSTFNKNLFYRNGYKFYIADPAVYYASESKYPEDAGYFYLSGTTSGNGFDGYRSKDLVNWEPTGRTLDGVDRSTINGKILGNDTWANEIVYDSDEQMWYMFFSASPKLNDGTLPENLRYLPYVAKSEHPQGPYELIEHTDYSAPLGGVISAEDFFAKYLVFNPREFYKIGVTKLSDYVTFGSDYQYPRCIDFHPFVDPETNNKYLYFTVNNFTRGTFICALEMTNWYTPKYETFTIITKNRYESPSSSKIMDYEMNNHINEGAWVNYHNGKYYLTLSINGYGDRSYAVIQAVSDSPLGVFRKLSEDEGVFLMSTDSQTRDDVSGPGHHSLITVEGKDYIVYHKHNSVEIGGGARHVNIDEVKWITTKDIYGDPLEVMHANGPTTSVQPLPEFASEYANVAPKATVKASNLVAGSKASYLNDDLIPFNKYANAVFTNNHLHEAQFKGKTTIELDFENYETMKAIMIYNSRFAESAFSKVKRIEFTYLDEFGKECVKFIDNFKYDIAYNTSNDDEDEIRPGTGVIAEFNEIQCKHIKIEIEPATKNEYYLHGQDDFSPLAVSEIKVLARKGA